MNKELNTKIVSKQDYILYKYDEQIWNLCKVIKVSSKYFYLKHLYFNGRFFDSNKVTISDTSFINESYHLLKPTEIEMYKLLYY